MYSIPQYRIILSNLIILRMILICIYGFISTLYLNIYSYTIMHLVQPGLPCLHFHTKDPLAIYKLSNYICNANVNNYEHSP